MSISAGWGDWACRAEETWIVCCDLHLAPWQPDMWDAAAGGRVFHVQWLSMKCLMRSGRMGGHDVT